MFDNIFEGKNDDYIEQAEINLENIKPKSSIGVRFTELNELILVEVTDQEIIVKQTSSQAN